MTAVSTDFADESFSPSAMNLGKSLRLAEGYWEKASPNI